tara:strand:- start:71 stop:364 length:294 start_codon:yes stop_codon:yes gene_type:complete
MYGPCTRETVTASGDAGRIVLSGLAIPPAIWLWTVSPQLLVHWSASGDVFVQTMPGGWSAWNWLTAMASRRFATALWKRQIAARCRVGWTRQLELFF